MSAEEDDYIEYLFSIDVYIHHIIIQDDLLLPNHTHQTSLYGTMPKPNCLAGFRLWNFPLLYIEPKRNANEVIEEQVFLPSGEAFTAAKFYKEGFEQITFHSGKSCVFKMEKDKLCNCFKSSPMYLFVFDYNESSQRPTLVGSLSISLGDLEVPSSTEKKHIISGQFTLKEAKGFDIGVVDLDIRLRLLDSAMIPEFHETLNSTSFSSSHRPQSSKNGINAASMPQFTRRPFTASGTGTEPYPSHTLISVTDNRDDIPPLPRSLHSSPMRTKSGGQLETLTMLADHYQVKRTEAETMKTEIQHLLKTLTSQLTNISQKLGTEYPTAQSQPKKEKKPKKIEEPLYYSSDYNQFKLWSKKVPPTKYNKSSIFIEKEKPKKKKSKSSTGSSSTKKSSTSKSSSSSTMHTPKGNQSTQSVQGTGTAMGTSTLNQSTKSNRSSIAIQTYEEKRVGTQEIITGGSKPALKVSLNLPANRTQASTSSSPAAAGAAPVKPSPRHRYDPPKSIEMTATLKPLMDVAASSNTAAPAASLDLSAEGTKTFDINGSIDVSQSIPNLNAELAQQDFDPTATTTTNVDFAADTLTQPQFEYTETQPTEAQPAEAQPQDEYFEVHENTFDQGTVEQSS